jgi:hypothetical protein
MAAHHQSINFAAGHEHDALYLPVSSSVAISTAVPGVGGSLSIVAVTHPMARAEPICSTTFLVRRIARMAALFVRCTMGQQVLREERRPYERHRHHVDAKLAALGADPQSYMRDQRDRPPEKSMRSAGDVRDNCVTTSPEIHFSAGTQLLAKDATGGSSVSG